MYVCSQVKSSFVFSTLSGLGKGRDAKQTAVPVAIPVMNCPPRLSLIRKPKIAFLPLIFILVISCSCRCSSVKNTLLAI